MGLIPLAANRCTQLLLMWVLQSIFDDLKPNLRLQSLATSAGSAEHMETAVLMLGVFPPLLMLH